MTVPALGLCALLICVPLTAAVTEPPVRQGNSIFFKLSDGRADLEWFTAGSFKLTRHRTQGPFVIPRLRGRLLTLELRDLSDRVVITSDELEVEVEKQALLLTIRDANGNVILRQQPPPREAQVRFSLDPTERHYGLGPRADTTSVARGELVTEHPLLLSSRKYGLFFPRSGSYRFDLGKSASDSLRVSLPSANVEAWCFYWGGNLKDVMDRHRDCDPPSVEAERSHTTFLAPDALPAHAKLMTGAGRAAIRKAVNASFSGVPIPAVSGATLSTLGEQLAGAVMPVVTMPAELRPLPAVARLRSQFETHLLTYFQEANDRGFPVLHPLPFQFPNDAEAARAEDEFMLGDELLAAPSFDMRARRVYLPQGVWTRLSTEEAFSGRQWIEITPGENELPLFARNGTIVPLNRSSRIELHYFPQLGAEYFIFEAESGEVTQTHASPAGDFLRLEIEEKVGREYDWVVHHADRPLRVEAGGAEWPAVVSVAALKAGSWFYDAGSSQLRLRIAPRAGDDVIVNAAFPPGKGVRSR